MGRRQELKYMNNNCNNKRNGNNDLDDTPCACFSLIVPLLYAVGEELGPQRRVQVDLHRHALAGGAGLGARVRVMHWLSFVPSILLH